MNKLLRLYVKVMYSEKGATAIEYAILVTLIAIAIMTAVIGVATALSARFNAVAAALSP
ncbi:MAG: Flp family type IVb pilin [Chloroflexi bacterium]|nr:Flp family type IVb pilin [Chloroflexota bacterium]